MQGLEIWHCSSLEESSKICECSLKEIVRGKRKKMLEEKETQDNPGLSKSF